MSDGKTPPHDPERDGAAETPAVEAVSVSAAADRGNRRRGMWAAAAVVCVLAGSAASVLGAHAVAKNDASKTETSFQHGSQAIASTLKLAVQRQEELNLLRRQSEGDPRRIRPVGHVGAHTASLSRARRARPAAGAPEARARPQAHSRHRFVHRRRIHIRRSLPHIGRCPARAYRLLTDANRGLLRCLAHADRRLIPAHSSRPRARPRRARAAAES
jgi:hypothetical protein